LVCVFCRQGKLEWIYDGKKFRNLGSNFVSTYRKQGNGEWLLLWQIWNTIGTEETPEAEGTGPVPPTTDGD
jgi:hypothetical protein